MAGRRKGGGGAGGAGGKVWGVLVTVFMIALALAFMRSNGITDVDGTINYFQGLGREAGEIYPKKIEAAVSKSCNFIKDASCLYDHSVQEKIGDVNKDGKIDDLDSREYAKENGVTLAPKDGEAGSANGGGSTSTSGAGDGGGASVPAGSSGGTVSKESKDATLSKLDRLVVAEPDGSEYKRSDYKHWITIEGSCDARETSMKMVGFKVDPKTCKPQAGFDYVDPYTGKTISDPRKLDLDHIIPLGFVNGHGGKSWSAEKKKQYANDVSTVLLPVDASANRQKGDKGPSAWMPSNKVYYCQYGMKWVDIASKYGISITSADKKVLRTAVESCAVK